MKTPEEMRPKLDVLVYRWVRNGMEQRFAKEQICESENRFEIRDARARFSRLEQEAGEIRDEIFETFAETRDPEFCDEYEYLMLKVWNTATDVIRLRREIISARTKEVADYFREALKAAKKQAETAVELLFQLLMDAHQKSLHA